MKRVFLFLMGLSLLAVSCDNDDKNPDVKKTFVLPAPTNKADVDAIVKVFENAKAGSIDKIKAELAKNSVADLEKWEKEYEAIKDLKTGASKGVAGKMGKRTVNAQAVETEQLIAKGLIGAFQLNGFNKVSMEGVGAKDAKARKEALNKAVAYLLGGLELNKTKEDFKNMNNSFGKYMVGYAEMKDGVYKAIEDAFNNADDAKKYGDAMLDLNKWATKVVAFRAVHYLAGYGGKIKQDGGFEGENIHELSEGLGFAYSLAFAYNHAKYSTYFTIEEAREFTVVDLWEEKDDKSGNSKLDKSAEKIAKMFGFKVADAL